MPEDKDKKTKKDESGLLRRAVKAVTPKRRRGSKEEDDDVANARQLKKSNSEYGDSLYAPQPADNSQKNNPLIADIMHKVSAYKTAVIHVENVETINNLYGHASASKQDNERILKSENELIKSINNWLDSRKTGCKVDGEHAEFSKFISYFTAQKNDITFDNISNQLNTCFGSMSNQARSANSNADNTTSVSYYAKTPGVLFAPVSAPADINQIRDDLKTTIEEIIQMRNQGGKYGALPSSTTFGRLNSTLESMISLHYNVNDKNECLKLLRNNPVKSFDNPILSQLIEYHNNNNSFDRFIPANLVFIMSRPDYSPEAPKPRW